MQKTITIEELAARQNVSVETMMKRVSRMDKDKDSAQTFGRKRTDVLTDNEIEFLTAGRRGTNKTDAQRQSIEIDKAPGDWVSLSAPTTTDIQIREQRKEKPQVKPSTPQPKKTDWLAVFEYCGLVLLGGIVIAHGALIWYEVNLAFSWAGWIAGLMLFLVVVAGCVVVLAKHLSQTSSYFLWVVGALDFAATYAHYVHFKVYGIDEYVTKGLSAFVAVCGFAAFYFFRQIITMERENVVNQ